MREFQREQPETDATPPCLSHISPFAIPVTAPKPSSALLVPGALFALLAWRRPWRKNKTRCNFMESCSISLKQVV